METSSKEESKEISIIVISTESLKQGEQNKALTIIMNGKAKRISKRTMNVIIITKRIILLEIVGTRRKNAILLY